MQFKHLNRPEDSTAATATVSMSEELRDIVDDQVDHGVATNRSEWFREAAWTYIMLQQYGADSLQGTDYDGAQIGATSIEMRIFNTRQPIPDEAEATE